MSSRFTETAVKNNSKYTVLSCVGFAITMVAGMFLLWLRHRLMAIASLPPSEPHFDIDGWFRSIVVAAIGMAIGAVLTFAGLLLDYRAHRKVQTAAKQAD